MIREPKRNEKPRDCCPLERRQSCDMMISIPHSMIVSNPPSLSIAFVILSRIAGGLAQEL